MAENKNKQHGQYGQQGQHEKKASQTENTGWGKKTGMEEERGKTGRTERETGLGADRGRSNLE